jgi:hypothetical protein
VQAFLLQEVLPWQAGQAHKKVIVATTPATADTSSNPQDSSFEYGSQSSNDGASNATKMIMQISID